MKKFILRSSVFSLILVLIFFSFYLFQGPDIPVNNYMSAIIDKHARIEKINSPKIILAGGSNIVFGIDSKQLEKTFNLPVVNLGLTAGLGLEFMLKELVYSIKEKDVVILSPEYFLNKDGSYPLKKNTSGFYPTARRFYSFDLPMELNLFLEKNHKIFLNYFSGKSSSENDILLPKNGIQNLLSRSAFNQNGDLVSHLNQPNASSLTDRGTLVYQYWDGIGQINKFSDFSKSKNVAVFFLFPSYCASEYEKNREAISSLELDLHKNLQIEILSSASYMVFPDSCFFNTVYHLNKSGRESRTQRIIMLIEKNINAMHALSERTN